MKSQLALLCALLFVPVHAHAKKRKNLSSGLVRLSYSQLAKRARSSLKFAVKHRKRAFRFVQTYDPSRSVRTSPVCRTTERNKCKTFLHNIWLRKPFTIRLSGAGSIVLEKLVKKMEPSILKWVKRGRKFNPPFPAHHLKRFPLAKYLQNSKFVLTHTFWPLARELDLGFPYKKVKIFHLHYSVLEKKDEFWRLSTRYRKKKNLSIPSSLLAAWSRYVKRVRFSFKNTFYSPSTYTIIMCGGEFRACQLHKKTSEYKSLLRLVVRHRRVLLEYLRHGKNKEYRLLSVFLLNRLPSKYDMYDKLAPFHFDTYGFIVDQVEYSFMHSPHFHKSESFYVFSSMIYSFTNLARKPELLHFLLKKQKKKGSWNRFLAKYIGPSVLEKAKCGLTPSLWPGALLESIRGKNYRCEDNREWKLWLISFAGL